MERRALGSTEIHLSAISLGAWAMGGWAWGGTDRKAALEALRACPEFGISTVDTAPVYGFGVSEELVGESIRGRRDRYEILTKCGLRWDLQEGMFYFETRDESGRTLRVHRYSGRDSIIWECEQSLRRLGTDYIDLYQIHWNDPTTPISESMEAFIRLKEQGKIRAAGVSNYSVSQMEEARMSLDVASNQVPYSMLRREIEQDLVPWCLQNKSSILAYSPLQRGLLTGKITPETSFAEGDFRPTTPWYRPGNIEKVNRFLDGLRPMAEEKGATLAQLVIRWTLQQEGITVALVGARNRAQVEQNAGAAAFRLEDHETAQITASLDALNRELDMEVA
jgi:aryl-alcohol dehydrogenase-like predicted oxidoreductase